MEDLWPNYGDYDMYTNADKRLKEFNNLNQYNDEQDIAHVDFRY